MAGLLSLVDAKSRKPLFEQGLAAEKESAGLPYSRVNGSGGYMYTSHEVCKQRKVKKTVLRRAENTAT